jgi:Uma2 family endonuclease
MPEAWAETIPVPATVRFPVELEPPRGFRPEDPGSWPRVRGRLEYVAGRLLYMPPCGGEQQLVSVSVATVLGLWVEEHPEFVAGGNEAGMLLGDEVRAADGAVWRRETVGEVTSAYMRVPPILAIEVEGREDDAAVLRQKAEWYLARGVQVVWLVRPSSRDVVVISRERESRHGSGDRLPAHPALPGLEPPVARFFQQLA